jgi:hypothetical protein
MILSLTGLTAKCRLTGYAIVGVLVVLLPSMQQIVESLYSPGSNDTITSRNLVLHERKQEPFLYEMDCTEKEKRNE